MLPKQLYKFFKDYVANLFLIENEIRSFTYGEHIDEDQDGNTIYPNLFLLRPVQYRFEGNQDSQTFTMIVSDTVAENSNIYNEQGELIGNEEEDKLENMNLATMRLIGYLRNWKSDNRRSGIEFIVSDAGEFVERGTENRVGYLFEVTIKYPSQLVCKNYFGFE